ncbi:hypothetical protein FRC03_003778 [Tulasnella sp. 419]|nr:hypothetical protein FRC03_003778 [Tulasnella sp. 419]
MFSSTTISSLSLLAAASKVVAQQPQWKSTGPGTFQEIGKSGVSAQMLFLGTPNKVYIIDKIENNPIQVGGHPAWAAEYNLADNSLRAMDVVTNTFCAGGNILGDGTWINVGGNKAVTYGGISVNETTGNPYEGEDGRFAVRFLKPCDDATCEWTDNPKDYMTTERWYPTIETLEDGSAIVIGGNTLGGFVSATDNNNPTYEFWPRRGDGKPITLHILERTLPANLYPLTFLLPSGNLFVQTNWAAEIFDYKKGTESPLPDIPHAVRTYPGSAANTMLPLTPANNWTATVVFCGGTDLQPNQWRKTIVLNVPASASCVRMSPDISNEWEEDESLPEGRVMGNFILLPNGKIFLVNGVNQGVAGYGNDTWALGQSYATGPLYKPLMYDPDAPIGSRFTDQGLSASPIPRLYHSTATLLPDGSVFVTGSNPNADVDYNAPWPTEYRVERFYPAYYDERRPEPQGLPKQIGYGGNYFDIKLSSTDLGSDPTNSVINTKVVLMRTGFSTHAVNFGQRYLQLNSTYTLDGSGSATLHVSQVPPNPALFTPGPAWIFVVVNGIPSIGQPIMIGSGKIELQNIAAVVDLPGTYAPTTSGNNGNSGSSGNNGGGSTNQPSSASAVMNFGATFLAASLSLVALGMLAL